MQDDDELVDALWPVEGVGLILGGRLLDLISTDFRIGKNRLNLWR